MSTPTKDDARRTLRTQLHAVFARTSDETGLRYGPATERLIEAIIAEIEGPAVRWAFALLAAGDNRRPEATVEERHAPSIMHYRGRPVEELSQEELIAALVEMATAQAACEHEWQRRIDVLTGADKR